MTQQRVVISGVGPVSGLGIGMEANWQALIQGRCAISTIEAFDPGGFDCQVAAEVRDFKVGDFVPKHYRKATKVMARDIELAVAAAHQAANDAGLRTPATDATSGKSPDFQPTYPPARVGCHIGADLIAADLNELTAALVEAGTVDGDPEGPFDMHKWGREGMSHLTPLWLLKYLPNMLACHVTIAHDTQGPSNTITCNETSSGLSIGESLRMIQRGKADASFCGGGSSKVNLTAHVRQEILGRLNPEANEQPKLSVRPFDRRARGTVIGEGAGLVILETIEGFSRRPQARAYAEVVGSACTQTIHRASRNMQPDPEGQGIASAVQRALDDAELQAEAIDVIVPFGCGIASWDLAEANAYQHVFGARLADIPVMGFKALYGNCGAASGGLDTCMAARMLHEQVIPPVINRDNALPGLGNSPREATPTAIEHVLVVSTGLGGQNHAMILKRFQGR